MTWTDLHPYPRLLQPLCNVRIAGPSSANSWPFGVPVGLRRTHDDGGATAQYLAFVWSTVSAPGLLLGNWPLLYCTSTLRTYSGPSGALYWPPRISQSSETYSRKLDERVSRQVTVKGTISLSRFTNAECGCHVALQVMISSSTLEPEPSRPLRCLYEAFSLRIMKEREYSFCFVYVQILVFPVAATKSSP